jgi:hypothetical protein
MLVEKPISNNDIVSIKISNGDELIAKFVETAADGSIVVSKPMLMVLGQSPSGQPGVQMMPFFMLGAEKEGKFRLNPQHVVCMTKSNSEAKAGYVQATTGIAVPKAGSASSLITE